MKNLQRSGKLALCAFISISVCAICAAPTNQTAQVSLTQSAAQSVSHSQTSLADSPKPSLLNLFQFKPITHRPEDKTFTRHHSPFSGPPGPTMPLGATRNPARTSTSAHPLTIRFIASSKPLVYDLPPGAKLRLGAAGQ